MLGIETAIQEAKVGQAAGGIPIGSALVVDGAVVASGHNQRVQKSSPTLHAEMDALENAGRLSAVAYRRSIIFTTLSPCDMCSGAILLYDIPKVVIGENTTFIGAEDHLRSRGVEVVVLNDQRCIALMTEFMATKPELWQEDIGESPS